MNNIKIINKSNLLHNLKIVQKYNKNICVMVKADAYGHNYKTIINELKNKVQWFGVANEQEALQVNKIDKNNKVLIVGKSADYYNIIKNGISFTIDSTKEINKIINICQKHNLKANIHIAINTGMNRLGVKDLNEFKSILNIINQNSNKINLEGVFTHCFKTKLVNDTKVAVVSIGYADGLPRIISNKKYSLQINKQNAYVLGNICMDMCMLDVTNLNCKVGDKVICYDNANKLAKVVKTSPYEILTNFQKLRGKTVVE